MVWFGSPRLEPCSRVPRSRVPHTLIPIIAFTTIHEREQIFEFTRYCAFSFCHFGRLYKSYCRWHCRTLAKMSMKPRKPSKPYEMMCVPPLHRGQTVRINSQIE